MHFQLFFVFKITDINTSDFELTCINNSLKFQYIGEYNGSKVAILEISNSEMFSVIFPFMDLISSMEDLVLWSSTKNCFTVDKKVRQNGVFDLIPVK